MGRPESESYYRSPSLSHGSVGVNSPSGLGSWGKHAAGMCVCTVCVCMCVWLQPTLCSLTAVLIRHPVPWQPRCLNSSVKSLSPSTHAHSRRRRERCTDADGTRSSSRRRWTIYLDLCDRRCRVFKAFVLTNLFRKAEKRL